MGQCAFLCRGALPHSGAALPLRAGTKKAGVSPGLPIEIPAFPITRAKPWPQSLFHTHDQFRGVGAAVVQGVFRHHGNRAVVALPGIAVGEDEILRPRGHCHPDAVALAQAAGEGISVAEYAPKSHAVPALEELADKIMNEKEKKNE